MAGAAKAVLSLEQIRAAEDVASLVDVEMKEWGGVVKVRGLSRGEVLKLKDFEGNDGDAWLVHVALVEPVLTLEEATAVVTEKGLSSVSALIEAILDASGIGTTFRQE
jgi:hypothetical protein